MIIFVKLRGFELRHFGRFGTINARYISRYERVSEDLIRLRNNSKLVKISLFAMIDLLQGVKFILFNVWEDNCYKKSQILEKKNLNFFCYIKFFFCYYCSIKSARQSRHSGLRPDTSSHAGI